MSAFSRRQIRSLRRRDGDNCWLCQKPVDFAITDPQDPGYRTRDHVVPRSQNGPGGLGNFRLAHRECNEKRGRETSAG